MKREIDEITGEIVDTAVKLHTKLGPGLLESVYEMVLARALQRRGLRVERQVPVSFEFDGMHFDEGFRVDLMVDGAVIVELKSVEKLAPVHFKQVLTYLRLLNQPVGLLINFGGATLKEGLHRIVNNYTPTASAPPREPVERRRRPMMESNKPTEGELILYQTPGGTVRIEVLYESETFWLNQKRLAELFGVDLRTISEHLQNIYASGELLPDRTIRKIRRVQREGSREVRREIEFYNLDAIISVGYRVNSAQATQFRIWATQTLREFVIKGFVLDDERLKLNKRFGKDYFDELLERIREIRASERRFYLKITDIYEQCSIDYDKDAEMTGTFFKIVQNKLHWAVTGKTAAEIIAQRAVAKGDWLRAEPRY